VGSASSALKVPALPPPGSDVKKAHSYPPTRSERSHDDPDSPVPASARTPDGADDDVPVLPVSSSGLVPWVIAAVVVALLALAGWKLLRRGGPAPRDPVPTQAVDAPPVTPVTPGGGAAPTLVPAPSWGDATTSDGAVPVADASAQD